MPFKGLTFSEEEISVLYENMSEYLPRTYSRPLYTIDMGKTKAKVHYVLSKLSSATVKEVVWNKQVSIVDWGYGQKYDFRKWTDDYENAVRAFV